MFIRRAVALLLLTALLLSSVCMPVCASESEYTAETSGLTVLYIPLDNRPFNDARVRAYAASLGISLLMPEAAYFATTLDGQTNSVTGLSCGDRGALVQWLFDHAAEADVLVISLDQLLSGGLMHSRTMEKDTDIVLPNGTSLSEYDVISRLAELADTHEIYLVDSVLRLATSYGYGGYTMEDYYAARYYGMIPRKTLTGDALTMENVIAGYPYAADGTAALDCTELSAATRARLLSQTGSEDSGTRLQRYLNIRARKLRLNAYAIELLTRKPSVHYTLAIDDSSSDCNIQSNEIALLEKLGGENLTVIDTLDGSAQQILTQLLAARQEAEMPSVSVVWFGNGADKALSYTRTTNRGSLQEVLVNLGCRLTESGADAEVLAWTAADSEEETTAELYRLAGRINENESNRIPTILVGFGGWSQTQKQLLAESCSLGYLLGVSDSFEMPSNAIMGLSQGIGRYLMLTGQTPPDAACNQAHLENLAMNLAMIFYHGSSEAAAMSSWFRQQGLSTTNFGGISAAQEQEIDDNLTAAVQSATQPAMDSLCGSTVLTALSPLSTETVSQAAVTAADYPWNRTFEISVEVSMELSAGAESEKILHSQFVHGTSSVHFSPEKAVTREQAAKLLVLSSETAVSTTAQGHFSDTSAWAAAYVQTTWEQGYLFGYPDGSFGGSRSMTRAEFCAMLFRCLQQQGLLPAAKREISFVDVAQSGEWYCDSVYTLARAGIISGYPDGSFRPNALVTRAEAVALLCRAFGRLEQPATAAAAVPRFSDVPASHWAFSVIQDSAVTHFCS